MPERPATALTARSILGLAIVALGVMLTLDNLGLFDFDDVWKYWPVALLLFGLAKLSSGERGKGLFWLTIGIVFLLPVVFVEFEWEDFWDYWPLFLIALGLYMVARSFSPRPTGRSQRRVRRRERRSSGETSSGETSSPDLDAFAFLSSIRRTVSSTDFRRADLTAVMGGCDIDLTAAGLAADGADIEMFAFWGGVTLRIPDDWEVDPQLAVIMGAIEDKTKQRATTGGRLTVKGIALMGGLEIRN